MALSKKQRAFIVEYAKDENATAAAKRAGYSERSAHAIGHDNLKLPEIKTAIDVVLAESAKRLEVSLDRIKREVAKIAFADMRDVTTWGVKEIAIGFDGEGKRLMPEDIGEAVVVRYVEAPFVTPIDSEDLPEHVSGAVSEVGLGREGFKIKMHPKLQALDMLTKMVGGYAPEEHVLRGPDGKPIQTDVTISPADAYRALKEAG